MTGRVSNCNDAQRRVGRGTVLVLLCAVFLATVGTGGGASAQVAEPNPIGPLPAPGTVTCYTVGTGMDSTNSLYRITDALGAPAVELVSTLAATTEITGMELVSGHGIAAWDTELGLIRINATSGEISDGPIDIEGDDITAIAVGFESIARFRNQRLFAVDRVIDGPDIVRVYDFVTGELLDVEPIDLSGLGIGASDIEALVRHPSGAPLYGVAGTGDDATLLRIGVMTFASRHEFSPALVGDPIRGLSGLGLAVPDPDAGTALFGTIDDGSNSTLHRISPSQGRSLGVLDPLLGDGAEFTSLDCKNMYGEADTDIDYVVMCPSLVEFTVTNSGDLPGEFTITPRTGVPVTLTLDGGETYTDVVTGVGNVSSFIVSVSITGQGGVRVLTINPDCPPVDAGIIGTDAPVEVMHATSCVAGNGRVDTNIVNTGDGDATYRIEFAGLTPREFRVAENDWWRMPITGRPDGDHDIAVFRDGIEVSRQTVTVRCDDEVPVLDDPEIQVVNGCRDRLGYLIFQFVNDTAEAKPYVIEIPNLPNRSTTAQAYGQSVRAVTGRQEGTLPVKVTSNNVLVSEFTVSVNCR